MSLATPAGRTVVGSLTWYSVLITCAVLLSIFMARYEAKRRGLHKDVITDAALYMIPLGILGARVYYVLFEWRQYSLEPIRILFIWQGGLAIYGALIGGALGLWIYTMRKHLSFPVMLDIFSPCVILSQAIGRWGNYFNQEAYGAAVSNPAHRFFPMAVRITTGPEPQWHYATFFYEFVWNLVVFMILIIIKKHVRKEGDLFLCYLMLYALGRTFIEELRTDSLMAFGGTIRISQLLSAVAVITILAYFAIRRLRNHKVHGR
jgi:phosphatidylglycerol:prolipoprotein diacylglycerol transferase